MKSRRELNLKLIREFVNKHLDKLSDEDLQQIDKTINSDNRKSQSVFHCIKCNYIDNADLNAAMNIRDSIYEN